MANKDVFISYKAEEAEEATWVKSVLESNGISCWMAPACIPGGSSYAIEIPQAIKGSKVFVLILSSKAQSSRWVSRELDLAINEGKIVMPFMLENCELKDDFNFYLTAVQRYTAYENKAAAIEKMLKEIKALIGSDEPEQASEEISVEGQEEAKEEEEKHNTTSSGMLKKLKDALADDDECDYYDDIEETLIDKLIKYDGKSILSFIFGIMAIIGIIALFIIPNVAIFVMIIISSIVAMVLSILSLGSIKLNNTAGKRFAILGQLLALISMFFVLVVPFTGVGMIIFLVISCISWGGFLKIYLALKK